MTVDVGESETAEPSSPAEPSGPEVLFEEARRRRRRRRVAGAWVLAALGSVALLGGLAAGGGSPAVPRHGRAGASSGAAPAATWHELTAPGGFIVPGAIVTDVVRWRGALYASSQGSGRVHVSGARGCPSGNDCAVVWRSVDGGRWHAVYATPSLGGGQGEWLQPLHGALLLGDSDQFSAVWRSTNGRTWQEVKLPAALAGGGLSVCSADAGRRVVLVGNGASLPPNDRSADLVWSAGAGLRLRPAQLPAGYSAGCVQTAGAGFAGVGGLTRSGAGPVLVRSATGLRWQITARLRLPRELPAGASQSLMIAGRVMVLLSTPGPMDPSARAQLWYSSSGRRWRRASVYGRLPLAGGLRYGPTSFPEIVAADGGLILYDSSNTALWWSADGRVWRRPRLRRLPPTTLAPQGVAAVGNTLVAIERARRAGSRLPAGATTLWQLTLSRR